MTLYLLYLLLFTTIYYLPPIYPSGRNPASDNAKFKKGCKILVQAILGKIETRSWGFPPIVVALFCILSCSFFIFGHIIFWHSFEISKFISDTYFFIALCFFLLILSILQFLLWYKFIGKLFSLMKGSSTVDGFFWRFLPVRIAFLNTYGIVPEYLFVKERLLEAIEELDET